jgi:tRNA:m4X modification enzyme
MAAAESTAEPPPPLLRCAFFVKSAGRPCGLNVSRRRLVPGHPPLCPQHEPGAEQARVPCPVDPSHTVLKAALQQHLRVCTAAARAEQVAAQPWYRRGANSGAQQQEREEGGWETDAWSGPSEEGAEDEDADANTDTADAAAAARERARPFRAAVGAHAGRAQRRAALVCGLGFDGFAALVARLDAAHSQLVKEKHPPVAAREGWRAAFCGGDGEGDEEAEEKDAAAAEITLKLRARARAFDPMMPVDGKHARQHAAVAAVLRARGLLPSPPPSGGGGAEDAAAAAPPPPSAPPHPAVLVELGAGKGYLTAWLVIESCSRPPPATTEADDGSSSPSQQQEQEQQQQQPPFRALVMVDAAGHMGRKADRRLRGAAPLLARVTADLRDVDLARLPGLLPPGADDGGGSGDTEDKTSSFLAVGKHLCGVATDYALRAFASGVAAAAAAAKPPTAGPSAVAVATCCHHRGRWRDFCGRGAWRASRLSRADFEAALWLCGWANSPAVVVGATATATADDDNTPRAWHRRLRAGEGAVGGSVCPDAALGRRCRELLDAARCAWLEARLQGRGGRAEGGGGAASSSAASASRVEHLFFVSPCVTPENRIILGVVA